MKITHTFCKHPNKTDSYSVIHLLFQNIDLHALTGWIPERVAIKRNSEDFDRDKEFKRIHDRFHKGHCLITIATGELHDSEADRAGLVPTHAYAMLDIRDVKGKKLFMLKNPWSHLRWKGNFSENDVTNWTPDLQKLLSYDPKSAQQYDNGMNMYIICICGFINSILE